MKTHEIVWGVFFKLRWYQLPDDYKQKTGVKYAKWEGWLYRSSPDIRGAVCQRISPDNPPERELWNDELPDTDGDDHIVIFT